MSTSPLTYLVDSAITHRDESITGKLLSRPALLVTDGVSTTYCCDVDIGLYKSGINTDANGVILKDPITGAPLTGPQYLRNVPLVSGNSDLIYAEVGNPCTLKRSTSGQYQVIGFSKEAPGTYTRVPVDLGTFTIGDIVEVSVTARPLTLIELSTFGTFGSTPFGAIGIFSGGALLRITS